MGVLEIKNLNKYYPMGDKDTFQALKEVNLSFEKGELVSIIGESGSGKSTLMNVIGGLDSDFEGEIKVEGENIGRYSEKEMVSYHKRKIGFVFQSFNLIPHLSVIDNVALAMTLSNVDKKRRMDRAKMVLSQLGLENQSFKKPNQLSGGQKQRVAIARALVNDPDIIIADEPTGSLDSQTSDQVLDIFEKIAESGKLVLIVTHSERVAKRSSRIVTISDGEIIGDQQKEKEKGEGDAFRFNGKEESYSKRNLSVFSAIRMALLNMKEKLGRNVLIAFGSSIGIMSIILMLSLGKGVNTYLTDMMNENVNPLVVQVRMTEDTESEEAKKEREAKEEEKEKNLSSVPKQKFTEGEKEAESQGKMFNLGNIYFEKENLRELKKIDHVKTLTEGVSASSYTNNVVEIEDEYFTFMNFLTISPEMAKANIAKGKMPREGEILISERLAENMAKKGVEVIGEKVDLQIEVEEKTLKGEYTVSGIYKAAEAAGPPGGFATVFMNMDTLSDLAEKEDVKIETNIVYLTAESEDFTREIKEEVKKLGYGGSTADILIDIFSQLLDIFTYILTGVAGISLIVSAIMILTVLYISVVERTQEIGVIKAIGGRRKDIRRIFVSESFLIGLFGGLLGVGVAFLFSLGGNYIVEKAFDATVIDMTPKFAGTGVLISVVISMIAGLLPANSAARLDPVEALRRD